MEFIIRPSTYNPPSLILHLFSAQVGPCILMYVSPFNFPCTMNAEAYVPSIGQVKSKTVKVKVLFFVFFFNIIFIFKVELTSRAPLRPKRAMRGEYYFYFYVYLKFFFFNIRFKIMQQILKTHKDYFYCKFK